MARIATIVLVLCMCMSETSLAGVVFEAGEVDSSTVKPGAYVEVIYGKGERDPVSGEWEKLDTVKGYIKAIDSETLTIGERFWKKKIPLERIQKLTIPDADRGIDKLRQPMDSLSVRMETRFRTGLMFEAGYFWGIRTEFLDFYSSGYKTNKGLPLSASLYINPIFSGERHGRLGLRGTYQTVQIFPKFPEQELLQRFPLVLEEDFRRHRDRHISGFTFRLVSILLVYQRVVHKSKRSVVLVDVAGGISYQSSSYNSGGEQLDSPRNFPCGSVGVAFLMPVHSRVSLQASVRKGWLVGYFPDPFISGMSVAIGPLLEF